jgi:hypothetical protein
MDLRLLIVSVLALPVWALGCEASDKPQPEPADKPAAKLADPPAKPAEKPVESKKTPVNGVLPGRPTRVVDVQIPE